MKNRREGREVAVGKHLVPRTSALRSRAVALVARPRVPLQRTHVEIWKCRPHV